MVGGSRFRLGRGNLTQLCITFLRYITGGHFRSEKNDPEVGQASMSQARPRDTAHLRPSSLAARTLSVVEHTLSTFGGDPCPVRRGLVAAVKCYGRKARFSLLSSELHCHYRFSGSWEREISLLGQIHPSQPPAYLAHTSTFYLSLLDTSRVPNH